MLTTRGNHGRPIPAAVAFEVLQGQIPLHAEELAGEAGGFHLPGGELHVAGLPDGFDGGHPRGAPGRDVGGDQDGGEGDHGGDDHSRQGDGQLELGAGSSRHVHAGKGVAQEKQGHADAGDSGQNADGHPDQPDEAGLEKDRAADLAGGGAYAREHTELFLIAH